MSEESKVIMVLQNAVEYRWHDIKADPLDVPKADPDRYMCARFDYITKTVFYDLLWYEKGVWWDRRNTGDFGVIAWRKIEPFTGGTI